MHSPLRPDAAPPPDLSYLAGKLAIVGVGARGAAAARALARDFPAISTSASSPSSPPISSPRLWALDSDAGALAALTSSSSPAAREGGDGRGRLPLATPVLLTAAAAAAAGASSASSAPRLGPAAAAALVAAVAGSDAGGRGNASAGDGGVAVVLGAACGTPGPQALLDTARAFASAGALTACAVAAPFGFEGASATRAAASAISALSSSAAHVAAVVDQAVLAAPPTEPGAPGVTMAEAVAIADAALAQCGRALLASLAAPDVLGVAGNGAASWHARDAGASAAAASPARRAPSAASLSLKNARRALLPPLAAALAPPGRSVLGRGSAAVEGIVGSGSGNGGEVASLVAALAADAVRAAAESPFLLDAAASSSSSSSSSSAGPSSLIGVLFLPLYLLSRAESRAAVQAAASAAAEAFSSTPAGCAAFVYAPLLEEEDRNDSELRVEVSLLATYPEATEAAATETKAASDPSALPEGVAAAIQGAAAAAKKDKEKEKAVAVAAAAAAAAAATSPPPPPPPAPALPIETPFTSSPRDTARNPNAVARSLDLPPAAAAWREARRAPAAPRVRYLPVGPDGGGAFSSLLALRGARDDEDEDDLEENGANVDEDDWESEEDDDGSGGRRGRGVLGAALASLASLRRRRGGGGGRGKGSSSPSASAASAAKTRDRVAGMLERERDFGP